MAAVDPTYPAYPIASILAVATMMLVLLTNFVRQSWNLGITFTCVWFLLNNLFNAVDAIEWSNNADVKLMVWCDITSRVYIAIVVGVNIAPLLITRRLYLIARLQSVELPGARAKLWDRIVEWTLGLVWPLISAGPLYYIFEDMRFMVYEGQGCTNGIAESLLSFVVLQVWNLLPSIISVTFYYPKVAFVFYRHGKEANRFLRSNNSVSRTNYFRILAIASIDLLLTVPLGLVSLAFSLREQNDLGGLPWYPGWKAVHSHWAPSIITYEEAISGGTVAVFSFYYDLWQTPIESFIIFSLFGLTKEARASYWHIICTICGWFGWKPASGTRGTAPEMGTIEFGERPVEDISLGSGIRTPSFVNVDRSRAEHDAERGPEDAPSVSALETDKDEGQVSSSDNAGVLDNEAVIEGKVEQETVSLNSGATAV